MILPDGSEIPDRPPGPLSDPAVKAWKLQYFSRLYGASPATIEKLLDDAHREYAAWKRRHPFQVLWGRFREWIGYP